MLLVMLFIHKENVQTAVQRCSQVFLKVLQYSRETSVLESVFNKIANLKACIFIKKETPTQVFSCKYCEIFENSFFIEHLFIILFQNFK